VLSLPALTSIAVTAGYTTTYVNALSGGDVELPLVTQLSGSVAIESQNAGSTIDLSSLTDFNGGSLSVTQQGTVLDPDLTTLNGVGVTLDGTGTVAVAQITSFTAGTLTLSGITLNMPVLTDAAGSAILVSGGVSVTLPALTDADGASLEVSGGASLTLPVLTSYTEPNAFSGSTLQASGTNSVLSLPALTSIAVTAGYTTTYVNALSGGDVELPLVTQLSGSVAVESQNAGSTIDLSSLTDFNGGSLTITSGGAVIDPNLTTLVNVTITTDSTGTLTLPANQTFSFPSGVTTFNTGTLLDQGNLDFTGSATVNVQGGLTINGQGGLSVSSNSTLQVSGNLLGDTTNAAGFNPLGTIVLDSGNGTNNPPQLLEAMSQDLGNVAAGFSDNFAYGTLQLAANTYVELVDNAANSPGNTPEALYVDDLIVPAGATLNLDGLQLYVHTEQINGTIVAGGAVVSGEVFNDVSGSGTLTTGDPGLSGWTVDLTNTATDSLYTTTTGSNGLFSLTGIAAGTYILSEVLQPGFAQTAPASPGTYTITVASGQTVTGENFGDHPTAAIGGVVFNDLNGDGTLESGEPGLSGWTVQLLNSSNVVIATATTPSGGSYSFTSLLPGTYTVQVLSESGYVASSPASVTVADDNGQSDTVNFGEFVPVTISGEVYSDSSGSGLSGWTVDLVKGSQTVQTTTGSDGSFSFTNVGPGTYTVEAVQQAGYVASPGPLTETPTSGTNISGLELGESQSLTISGQVFNDVAGSGTYAAGDQGLSGWTIDVLNSAHSVVASAQTGANGNYTLTGVGPGTYTVEEVPQSGYIQTTAPAIYSVTVVQGQNSTGLNFGDFQLATVGGELFNDIHDDGILDPGDPGLAGWTVELLNSASKVVATTATDSNGDYSFSGVGPGTYSIAEVLQPGYVQTAPSSGGLTVTASSGAALTAEDIGVFKAVSLGVSGLTTTPAAGLQSGMSLVVQWTDTNTGTLPASGSFTDQVVITNTTTDDILATGYVQYNAASLGNLAAGASTTQQYTFSLPNGDPGVGQIQFTVTADYDQNVSTPAGEPNDTATLTETSTLAPSPELVPSDVTGTATANPGESTSVNWTLTNSGSATASGPWTEQVLLATDSAGGNPTLLAAQSYPGSLGAGQSVSRSINVQVPDLPPGDYWFVVSENPLGQVFELNTANNTAVAAQPTSIAGGLTLTLASDTESDAAGSDATTATVTRNTDTTDALQVTITNSDPTDVTVPATATIPAGATSVTFPVGTIDNYVVEGTQTATLTASATGEASGSATLTVTDTNVPTLTVVLNSHTVNETDPNPATYGTVTCNTSNPSGLTVSLLSNETNKLTVPATVTIPAGAISATFPVTVVNDEQIDGNETATITASASGFLTGSDSAQVIDDNVPTLTLTLAETTVSEAAGADATTGTVSIASPAVDPITIVLGSSDTTAATVPTSIVIDAGQTSASFPIAAVNNGLDVGNQTAVITASVETDAGVVLIQGSAEASLLLLNANGPALSLSLAESTVEDGASATATVTRNTDTTDALVVTLSSSDPTEATVPPTVTIPAGQTSVSFAVNTIAGNIPGGLQQVQISATATGLDTGLATLGISEVELPDLVVSSVTAPTSGYDSTPLTVSWTVTNNGLYPASGSWVDQVYLDPVGGPQSTTPADSVTFNGTVNAGQSYNQTDTIPSPSTVGQYAVRVVTDSGQTVQELSYSDNTGVAAQPYNDQAAYTATVRPSATTVSAGTPVVLYGVATMTSNSTPAADVPVAVQILVAGTTRTLTATTAANGSYSVTFQPLPDEAGAYSVTAADPGVTNPPVQAQFEIVGMTASPATANVTVVPNTPLTGTFTLTNLSNTTLSGLTATSSGGPAGLTVQLTPPSQIAGDGTATLAYSLDDTSAQAASGVVTIQVTTTQGAVLTPPTMLQNPP
jgi:protocatechuate 3,4-dioxygenase beta subunit